MIRFIYRIPFAALLVASSVTFSGCAEETCGDASKLPVDVFVKCDRSAFAPADELGDDTLVVEGRIGDGPWIACAQPYPSVSKVPHLCDSTTQGDAGLAHFTCNDRLVTEVRARQGTREAQAFTYYNKLSCIGSRDLYLELAPTASTN